MAPRNKLAILHPYHFLPRLCSITLVRWMSAFDIDLVVPTSAAYKGTVVSLLLPFSTIIKSRRELSPSCMHCLAHCGPTVYIYILFSVLISLRLKNSNISTPFLLFISSPCCPMLIIWAARLLNSWIETAYSCLSYVWTSTASSPNFFGIPGCQTICMVTILASHDRIFDLLAPLLYWLLSSREVMFTMQGSRTARTAKRLTHTSGCPVRRFLHRLYVLPWVATPLMLPSRPSLSNAWSTIPQHFVPTSILRCINNIYVPLGAPFLWYCIKCKVFVSWVEKKMSECHASSTPLLRLAYGMRTWYGHLRDDVRADFRRSMEIGVFLGYLTTRPNLHVN